MHSFLAKPPISLKASIILDAQDQAMDHPGAMTHAAETGLHRICYISSARGDVGKPMLDNILDVSRGRNRAAGLTGMLIYHDGSFMQALEGPREAALKIFAWIKTDPRHGGLIQMQSLDVGQRMFRGWSMAFRPLDELNSRQRQDFIDFRQISEQFVQTGKAGDETAILMESFLSSFRDLA